MGGITGRSRSACIHHGGDGGDDEDQSRGHHPAAGTQFDMLAAIHDAEIGEQEYRHQHGPQGAVQMSGQRSHETGPQAQQKAVDARSHGEEQHPQRAGIEVEGRGLGIALDHYEQMYPFVLFHVAKILIFFKLAKYCNRKDPPIIVEKNINRHFILVCNDIQRPTGIC